MARRLNALLIAASLAIGLSPAIAAAPVYAKSGEPVKQSVAVGKGGAVASVNLLATAEGTRGLRDGGNAGGAAGAAAGRVGGGGALFPRHRGRGRLGDLPPPPHPPRHYRPHRE